MNYENYLKDNALKCFCIIIGFFYYILLFWGEITFGKCRALALKCHYTFTTADGASCLFSENSLTDSQQLFCHCEMVRLLLTTKIFLFLLSYIKRLYVIYI